MDGGSDLNIMYAETLDAMGIDRARIRPTRAPFHSNVLGKQAIPIEQINLPITFGNLSNYRTETLTFEELAAIGKDIAEGAPDMKWVAGSFEPTENAKEVLVDPDNSVDKMVGIGTDLSPK
ncbi:uncharacterized protein [Miscanthus floridulus]|uniref:uncharacterized protein n=1 Tax=Miscanthus floridulus TaxID=154761 RepID=UPI00345958E6